jgi:hypothetical protein
MSRERIKRDSEKTPGFSTHMLALAKPPSMLRGGCMRKEEVVLDS